MMLMKRRDFLKAGAAAGAMASLYGCAGAGSKASGHVVVVGGGYGGATVAKYLRMWSEGSVQVTLIERNPTFISCPISNLVIGGMKTMDDITVSYDNLKNKWGVRVIQDDVLAVDSVKRSVKLAKGGEMSYDRIVLSPGIDFMFDQVSMPSRYRRLPIVARQDPTSAPVWSPTISSSTSRSRRW
jgi:sulfite dehydrogenase